MRYLILCLILTSCASNNTLPNFNSFKIKFSEDYYKSSASQKTDFFNKDVKKVKVLILDSKINTSFFEKTKLFKNNEESDSLHGTEVASALYLRLKDVFGDSVSKYVEFESCEVWNNEWSSNENEKAHLKCYEKALKENFDFMNISIVGKSQTLKEKEILEKISNNGTIITVAAGNKNQDSSLFFPCSYELKNLFCVGGLNYFGKKSKESNFGRSIKYWSLSEVKVSTQAGEYIVNGTSLAAPQVLAMFIVKKVTRDKKLVKKVKNSGFVNKGVFSDNLGKVTKK